MGLSHRRGRRGEDLALNYFDKLGYCLVKRNYRVRAEKALSEIDLIVLALDSAAPAKLQEFYTGLKQTLPSAGLAASWQKQNSSPEGSALSQRDILLKQTKHFLSLVFVEVKFWKAYPVADLCYNLSPVRQKRMFETAECFLQDYPAFAELRHRFDLLIVQGENGSCSHIENAFL